MTTKGQPLALKKGEKKKQIKSGLHYSFKENINNMEIAAKQKKRPDFRQNQDESQLRTCLGTVLLPSGPTPHDK